MATPNPINIYQKKINRELDIFFNSLKKRYYNLDYTRILIKSMEDFSKRGGKRLRPILIIQGRQDQTVHPTVPETIYASIGSSYKEIHWMENSTHCVILDKEYLHAAEITGRFMDHVLAEINH